MVGINWDEVGAGTFPDRPPLEPFDNDPIPMTAWRAHADYPPARPWPSVHIATQGPAEGWHSPQAHPVPFPQLSGPTAAHPRVDPRSNADYQDYMRGLRENQQEPPIIPPAPGETPPEEMRDRPPHLDPDPPQRDPPHPTRARARWSTATSARTRAWWSAATSPRNKKCSDPESCRQCPHI